MVVASKSVKLGGFLMFSHDTLSASIERPALSAYMTEFNVITIVLPSIFNRKFGVGILKVSSEMGFFVPSSNVARPLLNETSLWLSRQSVGVAPEKRLTSTRFITVFSYPIGSLSASTAFI